MDRKVVGFPHITVWIFCFSSASRSFSSYKIRVLYFFLGGVVAIAMVAVVTLPTTAGVSVV